MYHRHYLTNSKQVPNRKLIKFTIKVERRLNEFSIFLVHNSHPCKMHAFHAFTLLVLFFGSFAEPKSVRIVETKSGPIKGQSATTLVLENDYFAFKGIPYAEPPIKSLRFKVKPETIIFACMRKSKSIHAISMKGSSCEASMDRYVGHTRVWIEMPSKANTFWR